MDRGGMRATAKDGGVAQGCMDAFSQQSSIPHLLYYEGTRAAGQKHLCSFSSQLYPLQAHCYCIALPFCHSTEIAWWPALWGCLGERESSLDPLCSTTAWQRTPQSEPCIQCLSACGCDTCDSEHRARFVDTLGCGPLYISVWKDIL